MPATRRSAAGISRNMAAIRSTENRTERDIRRLLHAFGFRFRKYARRLEGKPDIVFTSARVAVFIDGDYWHARALREDGPAYLDRLPTGNPAYWRTKFTRRLARDDHVTAELTRLGWLVLRFWESDAADDPLATALAIADAVRARSATRC